MAYAGLRGGEKGAQTKCQRRSLAAGHRRRGQIVRTLRRHWRGGLDVAMTGLLLLFDSFIKENHILCVLVSKIFHAIIEVLNWR